MDLLAICHHEAGHAYAAEVLTGEPHAVGIELTDAGYFGQTEVQTDNVYHRRVIAIAGAVAEEAYLRGWYRSGQALLDAIWARMSEADRNIAGNFSRADADQAIRIIFNGWAKVKARAQLEADVFSDSEPSTEGDDDDDDDGYVDLRARLRARDQEAIGPLKAAIARRQGRRLSAQEREDLETDEGTLREVERRLAADAYPRVRVAAGAPGRCTSVRA